MKAYKVIKVTIPIAMSLAILSGCGSAPSFHESGAKTNTQRMSNMVGMSMTGNLSNMPGMNMPAMPKPVNIKAMGNSTLCVALNDEFQGFNIIADDVAMNDYKDATYLANNLHDEFHAVILPPLHSKKGTAYAEAIHGKYDELQDAIKSRSPKSITDLLTINRNNLKIVAEILEIQLKQS